MDSPHAFDEGSFRRPVIKVFHLDGERGKQPSYLLLAALKPQQNSKLRIVTATAQDRPILKN